MDWLAELTGRLHPLVVHLPIGFLALGLILGWKARRNLGMAALLPRILLWTGIAGALACITGYLHYRSDGYSYDTVSGHLWFGIGVTLFCFLLYAGEKRGFPSGLKHLPRPVPLILGFVLIAITGHLGGNITHGEGYLTEPLPQGLKKALGLPVFEPLPIALTADSWEEADLYAEVVHPILNNKCVSCHGPRQAKGGLRLHRPQYMLDGGENGSVFDARNPDNGELLRRILLPAEAEGHMPPEEKEPLTRDEINLLRAWIGGGHAFEGSIQASGLGMGLFENFFPKDAADVYPETALAPISGDSLEMATEAGIHVEPISLDLPWLRVSALNKPGFALADTVFLNAFREHIAELDLAGTAVNDSVYGYLKRLPNLTYLDLGHTGVTDQGLEALAGLANLKRLNLNHTGVTPGLFRKLETFPALEQVFVFGTALPADGPEQLKDGAIAVEYGGYALPVLASDSIIY